MRYLKTYENFGAELSVVVYNYDDFFKIIYGDGGLPKDETVFDRISYMDSQMDFGWNARDINPYFVVLYNKSKIIGVAKIGEYPYKPKNRYSLSYLSIDKKYQGLGYSKMIVSELFNFLKNNNLSLDSSRYTDIGEKRLRKILNEYSKIYNVEFIDNPLQNKTYENFGVGREMSSNVIEFEVDYIDDSLIQKYQEKYPDKWILYYDNDDIKYVFVKDKPNKYVGKIPKKVYHVSYIDDLDIIGIKTSTELNSPFGYYNISFFYLNEDDALYGSIPYEEGTNFLYEIDTNSTSNWLEGFNEPIDGEENITTSDFIKPEYIKKIEPEYDIVYESINNKVNDFYYLFNSLVYIDSIERFGDEWRIIMRKTDGKERVYIGSHSDISEDFKSTSDKFELKRYKEPDTSKYDIVYYIGNKKIETLRTNLEKKLAYALRGTFAKNPIYKMGKLKVELNR